MILAILDDLMFTSKIRAAAKPLGVVVSVARSAESALTSMRSEPTSLVIFDLSNPRIDSLGILGAMKTDPALAGLPTLGFASHIQADVIDAARRAGIGAVMARSAFAEQLPALLAQDSSGGTRQS